MTRALPQVGSGTDGSSAFALGWDLGDTPVVDSHKADRCAGTQEARPSEATGEPQP
ncbi:hypothetical protein SAMN06265355_107163 [Actinomadura mexicana]|uniref:Uncharacterized protein n=1 Tax=Actinomadura mexicana TaxID=134959 RepID=A0A238ZEG7_9ACTN|nr:hypothetical protein SAMN06265355_107163 [Actinomadura mexicana]